MSIGTPISNDIISAIHSRERKISSDNKSKEDLKFTHANGSWVVMRSLAKVKGGFDISKSFILTGGSLKDMSSRTGIDRGVNKNASNSSNAYYQSDLYGFRPMPGITNVNSQPMGSHGATRKTVVSYTVHSKEDLDIASQVFMNFGINVLIEIGHSVYIDKQGNVKEVNIGDIVPNDSFYGSRSIAGVENTIKEKTKELNYHYEGIFGVISNFSFDVGTDGTYNCSVTITSHNHISDSLGIPSVIDNLTTQEIQKSESDETASDVTQDLTNVIGVVSKRFRNYPTQGQHSTLDVLGDGQVQLSNFKNKLSDFAGSDQPVWIAKPLVAITQDEDNVEFEPKTYVFTTLRFFMSILNAFVMPRAGGNRIVRMDTGGHPFTTFNSHFSGNPEMCLVPRATSGTIAGQPGSKFIPQQGTRLEALAGATTGASNNILDIRVSMDLIDKVNNQFINQSPKKADQIGLTDFLESLMDEVQKYLGDVNNFVLATEPESGDLAIYDDTARHGKGPEINISGLETTVTNVSIQSNISGRVATANMLAGAGVNGNGGKTQTGLENWNKGEEVADGITYNVTTKQSAPSSDEEPDKLTGAQAHAKVFIDTVQTWCEANVIDGTFDQMMDNTKDLIKGIRGTKRINKFRPIPVDLNIEMMGIGGIKNLTCFSIPDNLLIKRVAGKNFMVFGVEHTLDAASSMWTTAITGMLKPH